MSNRKLTVKFLDIRKSVLYIIILLLLLIIIIIMIIFIKEAHFTKSGIQGGPVKQ